MRCDVLFEQDGELISNTLNIRGAGTVRLEISMEDAENFSFLELLHPEGTASMCAGVQPVGLLPEVCVSVP